MTWIQTNSGKRLDVTDPEPDQIDIFDIAHALANTCRFGGHCRTFYSVAQHSVHVSYLVPEPLAVVALLHDAAEAYLTDVPSPFKELMPDYQRLEHRLWRAIAGKFGLPTELPEEVKHADLVALATERRDLLKRMPDRWPVLDGISPDPVMRKPVNPDEARRIFLIRYGALKARMATS